VRRESDSGLAAIFSDAAGTTPITNPSAFADSVGRFTFYAAGISEGYSVLVTKGAESFTLHNVLDSDVGFIQSGAGAVTRTVQDKERDIFSVFDFMTAAQIADVRARTAAVDVGAAIIAALDAVDNNTGTLYFPSGIYAYATSPNFARAGVNIFADRGTLFKHTGTGNAFTLDGGAAGSGILGLRYDNITVQGNANSTNGIYVRSIHHSVFLHARCTGCATTGAAILVEWGVVNTWINPTVSVNEGAFAVIPLYGMKLSRRSGTDHTTEQTVISPIFEGLTQANGAGIYIDFSSVNKFIGGTSESNTNGLIITNDSGSGMNSFDSLFFEANTTFDVSLVDAVSSTFKNIAASSGTVSLTGSANRNIFIGGYIDVIECGASTQKNTFIGTQIITTRTDSSASGNENEWINCTGPGGTTYTNKFRGGIAATTIPQAYSASITIDCFAQDIAPITVTDGVAFTIQTPTNPTRGQSLTIGILNASGGAVGALTWAGDFKMATWVSPATGFGRYITFYYSGTFWKETSRNAADIPN
jgi:hypothetical protein